MVKTNKTKQKSMMIGQAQQREAEDNAETRRYEHGVF